MTNQNNASDLRPSDAESPASPHETGASHQLQQLNETGELLTKVLPAGGPLQRDVPFPIWDCAEERVRAENEWQKFDAVGS